MEINDLPIEMLGQIFQHSAPLDLLNIRLVCKLWKAESDRLKLQQLIILSSDTTNGYNFWFHTNKLLARHTAIDYHLFPPAISFFKLTANLKRLHIRLGPSQPIEAPFFVLLSQLKALQHLELFLEHLFFDQTVAELSLPELRIFKMNNTGFSSSFHWSNVHPLILRLPKLKHLFCDQLPLLRMIHPDTVTHLTVPHHNYRIYWFANLEYLRCPELSAIKSDILGLLKQLEELNVFEINKWTFETYQAAWTKVGHLLKQKRVLRRTKFKFFYQGVLISNVEELNGFDYHLQNTALLIRNYHNLASDLSFVCQVNYSDLVSSVDVIPADYPQRFFNIQRVETRQVADQAHFVAFLKSLYAVRSLILTDSSLDTNFYAQLPGICPHLVLLQAHDHQEATVNLDSVLRLRNLVKCHTLLKLMGPFDLAIASFTILKRLKEFSFQNDLGKFEILRYSPENYNLTGHWTNARMFMLTGIKFDQLISQCTNLKKGQIESGL